MDSEQFFAAIREGRKAEVMQLLHLRPTLIHEKEDELSPILAAVYSGHPEIADWLSEKTVVLTIFEAAALGKRNQLARLLARDPGLVDSYSEDGYQPLGLACYFGHQDCAQYLIAAGARVNSRSKNPANVTCLHSAVAGRHPNLVKLLLKQGADPNARQQGDFTPLHLAAQNGDLESIRALLYEGADADVRSADGKTPLDCAMERNQAEAVSLLKEGITKRIRSR